MIMPVVKLRPNRVIIDIDTQEHFFSKHSFVCVRRHRPVLANILRVINWAHRNNIRRISTVQTLSPAAAYCPRGVPLLFEGGKLTYTIRGKCAYYEASDCTDLPQALFEQYEQLVLCKRCFDPFEEPRLDRTLTELKADEFVLVGAATEGAVRATALGLLARGKKVTIISDATGSYDYCLGRLALRVMSHRGARIIRAEMLLDNHHPLTSPVFEFDWR